MRSWIILSGEYPPKIGGVSAYTQNIAVALSAAGDQVDVWAPSRGGPLTSDPGVTTHTLPDHLGPRSLLVLERELARRPKAQVLLQYVPHAFGMRAMNVPFALWIAALRRSVWVMYHEVAVPIVRTAPWRHQVIGAVTNTMASLVTRKASRIFVSTTAWNPVLRKLAPRSVEPTSLPIPSNVLGNVAAAEIARTRAQLGLSASDVVIGAFGTFGHGVADLLVATLSPLLARDPARVALLVGRGSAELKARAFGAGSSARVVATGELDMALVPAHLASCTFLLQPYGDGVTSRRTTAMAGLALGVPIVTNEGELSEPLWRESGAMGLASSPSVDAIVAAAESFLADPSRRATLGAKGRAFYERTFSLERSVRTLRDAR